MYIFLIGLFIILCFLFFILLFYFNYKKSLNLFSNHSIINGEVVSFSLVDGIYDISVKLSNGEVVNTSVNSSIFRIKRRQRFFPNISDRINLYSENNIYYNDYHVRFNLFVYRYFLRRFMMICVVTIIMCLYLYFTM